MATLTPSELMVRAMYEEQKWKVLRGGAPDFIFYTEKDGKIRDVRFVEVKSSSHEKLTPNQELYRKILLTLGANYVIEPFDARSLRKGEQMYKTCYLRNLKFLDDFLLNEEMKTGKIVHRIEGTSKSGFTSIGFVYEDALNAL